MKKVYQIILATLFLSISFNLAAETRVIDLTLDGCSVKVDPINNNGCDESQCKGIEDCICVGKNDKIVWNMPGERKFKFKFKRKNPLKNCGESYTNRRKECPIRQDLRAGDSFKYDIFVKDCIEVLDPVIIIKASIVR